jgi:Spy/CpxP family protein refolding chaperone
MKKLIAIGALLVSASVFAENNPVSSKQTMMQHGNMNTEVGTIQLRDKITPEQKVQIGKIKLKYQKKNQREMLKIREIDIDIEKEMLAEKIDSKKIEKLIDKKASVSSKIQKNLIDYRIYIKEKFGVNIVSGMMKGSNQMMENMDKKTMGNMDQMMNSMHKMTKSINQETQIQE